MKRISPISNLDAVAEVKFIIEAIPENEQMKLDLFRSISKIMTSSSESPILASNTSSISITKLASSYKDPSKFVGMHFMNPVPVMKLVELISGKQTSAETLQITRTLAGLMGKTTTVSQDVPGFIANRLLMPYLNEAIFALYEGVGTREDIDTTMLLGTNVPMGPLKLADFIGLDTCLAITKVLHTEFGDSKYRPCPLLVQMVNAGYLGKKSGKGFYEYHN
jgi:3-hydroxybutyryl-CoA dehydrogenase